MGKEDDAIGGRGDFRSDAALVGIDDASQRLLLLHLGSRPLQAIEDAGLRRADGAEAGLVDDLGVEIGDADNGLAGETDALGEAEDRADHLRRDGAFHPVIHAAIEGVGLGLPDLPVVVEQGGVEGEWLAQGDIGHAEQLGSLGVFIAGAHEADVGHEVAGDVEAGQLDAVGIALDLLEEGGGDALRGLAPVVAGEHAVDVCPVHRPEAFLDVHGEGVDGGDDEDLLVAVELPLLLQAGELAHELGADVLLLYLIAPHGFHDG